MYNYSPINPEHVVIKINYRALNMNYYILKNVIMIMSKS